MKKLLANMVVLAMILAFASCRKENAQTGTGEQVDRSVTLKIGMTFNIDDYRSQDLVYFTELAKERSGGTIEFQLFPNEQLVQGREALQGVSQGIIDGYMTATTYIGGLVPAVVLYDLPRLIGKTMEENLQDGYDFMNQTYDVMLPEFQKAGVMLVGGIAQAGTTEWIFNKPLYKLEDYRGRKIRTVGGTSDIMLRALGASPVFISSGDLYMGLQTGVVDGSQTTANTILASKLYELCPYLTEPTLGGSISPYLLILNQRKWDALSDNQKNILKTAADETFKRTISVYPTIIGDQRKEALAHFKEVYTLPDDEYLRISETALAPVWDEMLKNVDNHILGLVEIRRKFDLGQ
jgi:TRAP-type C4-dicarboxylate transport system substrate-binding protein